jgi:hypothetical protein
MPGDKVSTKSEKKTKVDKVEKVEKVVDTKKKTKDDTKKTETVDKKKNKYDDVEKGDAPNKPTALAGLTFNVKHVQKWLKEYLNRYSVKTKDKDGKEVDKKFTILNAHFAISAADHVICLSLVNLVATNSKKSTANLNTITEESMINAVKLDDEFKYTFGRFLDKYDSHESYNAQLTGLEKRVVLDYISSHGFVGGSNSFHFEVGAYNFLTFIMLKNRILLTESAFQMSQYAKRSLDDRAVMFALKTIYTGKLLQSLYKKVEEVSSNVRGLKKEKDSVKDDESVSDDSSAKVSKKDTKGKKVVKKVESESEESDSGSGSESESDEDSD